MKNILNKFKNWIIFWLWLLFVLWVASAWVNLSTVNTWDSLTSTKWNDLVTKINDIWTRTDWIYNNSWNIGIWVATPTAKLDVNWTIVTDANTFASVGSVMPNNMSYSAWWNVVWTTATLNKWVYLVKYYMCTSQNSFTWWAYALVTTISWTTIFDNTSYISSNTNSWDCWFFDSSLLKVTSNTAQVAIKINAYLSWTNTDNNPTANSVSATFVKIY